MTFFNKKEEVLDIKLTQFGKQLLSTGRLRPVYYAFFDDNILYDGAAGGISEVQNNIEGRIQENTPQNKTQHVFSSIENTFSKYLDQRDNITIPEPDRVRVQADSEKNYSLTGPLGHSDLDSEIAPAWKITILEGEIQNSVYFLTGTYQDLRIPQLDLNITYTTKVLEGDDAILAEAAGDEDGGIVFEDGSVIEINIKDALGDLMVMVEESGVNFKKENFEIEVYHIEPTDNSLTTLSFTPKKSNIVDGLLVTVDPPETFLDIDDTFVEFYFDISADSQINKKDLCEAISRVKSKGIYVDSQIECDKLASTPTTLNPYTEGSAEPFCADE